MNNKTSVFTIRIPGALSEIRSAVAVANPKGTGKIYRTLAVWDTGSPICFISEKLMKCLGLKFKAGISGRGFFGDGCTTYGTVAVRLVSGGRFFTVSAAVVEDLHRGADCQMLIGMNLIAKGQLSLSYKDGVSTFSFALPAVDAPDLTDSAENHGIPIDSDNLDLCEI